jgi:hypothetical protein
MVDHYDLNRRRFALPASCRSGQTLRRDHSRLAIAKKAEWSPDQGTRGHERSFSSAEERKPDDTKDQDREAGGNCQQREHRRSRLGLSRFGRGFNDLMVPLRCHGGLNLLSGCAVLCRGALGQRFISNDVPLASPGRRFAVPGDIRPLWRRSSMIFLKGRNSPRLTPLSEIPGGVF